MLGHNALQLMCTRNCREPNFCAPGDTDEAEWESHYTTTDLGMPANIQNEMQQDRGGEATEEYSGLFYRRKKKL